MGSGALPTRADLDVMDAAWWNAFQDAIKGDFVPRDASTAVAGDYEASLGSALFRWKRLNVKSGHFSVGDIKYRHSYNGLTSPGAGWMLCDGRQITEANYDAEHGAGAWAEQIGTSSLEDKFLPNLIARYAVGKAATSQDGSIAITPVGNTSHLINLRHGHQWYQNNGAGSHDTVYDSNGAATTLSSTFTSNLSGNYYWIRYAQQVNTTFNSAWSDKQLGTAVNIQPESIEAQPYMRII